MKDAHVLEWLRELVLDTAHPNLVASVLRCRGRLAHHLEDSPDTVWRMHKAIAFQLGVLAGRMGAGFVMTSLRLWHPLFHQERIGRPGEIAPAQWMAMSEFLHSDVKARCRASGVRRCSVNAGAALRESNRCPYRARGALHPRSKFPPPVSLQHGGLCRPHLPWNPVPQAGSARTA